MVEGKPSTCFRLVFTLPFQECKYDPGKLASRYGREPDKDQALRQIRQSLSTLHSQAGRNRESVSGALHPLNSVHEKDFPWRIRYRCAITEHSASC